MKKKWRNGSRKARFIFSLLVDSLVRLDVRYSKYVCMYTHINTVRCQICKEVDIEKVLSYDNRKKTFGEFSRARSDQLRKLLLASVFQRRRLLNFNSRVSTRVYQLFIPLHLTASRRLIAPFCFLFQISSITSFCRVSSYFFIDLMDIDLHRS